MGPVIGITGLNATDNPAPGVAVITALRADPDFHGKIIGLAYDALDPGLYRDGLLDEAYLLPYPSAGREALFARLGFIRAQTGLNVLLPTLDSELPALLGQEGRLRDMGIHSFLPTPEQFAARTKEKLAELDMPVPRSVVLHDPAALYDLDFEGKIVIKGVFYGAKVTANVHEAVAAFHHFAAKWGLPIIAQDYVAGEERNVCAVGDGDGGCLGAVAMRKLMITDSGKGWAGVTIHDPELLELTTRFFAETHWRGPCELEFRGGHLLEVNPRFPAWCDLTQGAGQNQPAAVVAAALGQDIFLPPARAGVAFVRISLNQIVEIDALAAIATSGNAEVA